MEFGLIQWHIKNTRLFPKTELTISLKAENDDSNKFEISNDSLQQFKEMIKDVSLCENQDILIERFDSERNFYINLITIISILLAVFGIIPVFYGLLEKSESVKIRDELEALKNEYNSQLDDIKMHESLDSIKDKYTSMNMGTTFLIDEKTKVNSEQDLEKYMQNFLTEVLDMINIDLLKQKYLTFFSMHINNLMLSSIDYVNKKYNANYQKNPNGNFMVSNIQILKTICIILKTALGADLFVKIVETINLFPIVSIDFTNF